MRLAVALLFGTVGYTLLYAGMKGGPGQSWAHAPWLLWVDAFKELGTETTAARQGLGVLGTAGQGAAAGAHAAAPGTWSGPPSSNPAWMGP